MAAASTPVSQPRDLKLIVQKDVKIPLRDGTGGAPNTHYHAEYNAGTQNTIYAGGDKSSYLLLPIIPPKQ